MKNTWTKSKNDYYLSEISQQTKVLPVGIYKLNLHPVTKECYLTQTQEKFSFSYKIYGIETDFIERVEKTYKNTTGNLGILLNGVKGTGKTVTAQMICNVLNLPVIIVHTPYEGISSFISEIQQDILMFFDEYEKMYNNYDSSVLTVMDGVLNNEFRKTFLLTTNSMYINENMLQRPSRIRYIKTFEDLTLDVIMEVVDDKLLHKEFREQCVQFVSKLETITIDIVKAVIDEVNIHKQEPNIFKNVFNIKSIENTVNLYTQGTTGLDKLLHSNVQIFPFKFNEKSIGSAFRISDYHEGKIINVISEEIIVVRNDDVEEGEDEITTYRIERVDKKHKSFESKFLF
jgi:SpoVK/Ycf46/Vps4 family AAA+-type ATPase